MIYVIFCALCPCPNIRADIIKAKTQYIARDGLKFGVRTLEDVERIGKICGLYPELANKLFQNQLTAGTLKKALGIHAERNFPEFPPEDFSKWAKKRPIHTKSKVSQKQKIAYFAGCTAKHLFPEVPKAVVEVFQKNGFDLYYLDQQCCGMPTLLEGDRSLTLKFVEYNLDQLEEVVKDGYSIICSCPTCGYMLKTVLKEGAYYSQEYQTSVGADNNVIKLPEEKAGSKSETKHFLTLQKSIYGNILKDDGYFSSISPQKRIRVAENTYDVGEFLAHLHESGELNLELGEVSERIAYYPPCHLREQNIGRPYPILMDLIPGISIEPVDWSFYCCGMAGIMGFKKDFHESSIQMGLPLIKRIEDLNPERLVTDCLSCRLQFNQTTSCTVSHPIEILRKSYENGEKADDSVNYSR